MQASRMPKRTRLWHLLPWIRCSAWRKAPSTWLMRQRQHSLAAAFPRTRKRPAAFAPVLWPFAPITSSCAERLSPF